MERNMMNFFPFDLPKEIMTIIKVQCTHVHDPDGVGDQHSGGTYGNERKPCKGREKKWKGEVSFLPQKNQVRCGSNSALDQNLIIKNTNQQQLRPTWTRSCSSVPC